MLVVLLYMKSFSGMCIMCNRKGYCILLTIRSLVSNRHDSNSSNITVRDWETERIWTFRSGKYGLRGKTHLGQKQTTYHLYHKFHISKNMILKLERYKWTTGICYFILYTSARRSIKVNLKFKNTKEVGTDILECFISWGFYVII